MKTFPKLMKAEAIKILGNYGPTAFLVGIFPVMAAAFIGFWMLFVLLSADARQTMVEEPIQWTDVMVGMWNIPNNIFGRAFLLAFVALQFGGEYQWNTWKNLVPRSERVPLILAKFLVVGIIIVVAFILTSIITGVGMGLVSAISHAPYGPELSGDVLSEFAEDYLLQAATAFVGTVIGSGYAMIAAMLTRSILGSLITSYVIATAEGLSVLAFLLVAFFLKNVEILRLYRYTPTYNLFNAVEWINSNAPTTLRDWDDNIVASDSLTFSLIVLFVWVFALISLTAIAFQRQDITN
ncbi:MAG: hypothetical protein KJ064_11175 [Anaerolineae bacterium]|nr:hypothetical protein [Anaerolineae bacterium]